MKLVSRTNKSLTDYNTMGKARGSFQPKFVCCLPWWTLNPAGFSNGGMHCGKYVCEPSNIRWRYVYSAPVLLDSKVFWKFVVTMLLKTKSPLIVTKQLMLFFAPKSINSLFHQIFWWTVYVYNCWPS